MPALALAPLLLLAGLGPTAQAAGFYYSDSGTRAMARGGAFVAGADDLSAQYYNPAALMHLDRPQVYVNYTMFHQSVQFTREDLDETGAVTETWPTVKNGAAPMQIPAFGVGHHFGLPNTYFAFGMWTPMAPSLSFPSDGSTHYTLKDSLTWQIWGGPSVAQRIGWLSVGVGVHWTLIRAEQSLDLMVCQDEAPFDNVIGTCPEDASPEENDLHAQLKMYDPASLAGNFGVLAEPVPWLSIGASVLPPLDVKGKGSLEVQLAEDHWLVEGDGDGNANLISSEPAIDDDVTVLLNMPWIVRMGVAVRPVPEVEVEAAAIYQRWSSAKEIRVTDVDLVLESTGSPILPDDQTITDDVVLPQGYQDAWSLRLGGDADVADFLTVRAGGFWESSAIPTDVLTVTLVDGPKWGVAGGLSARIKDRVSIDAGFIQTFIAEQHIQNSRSYRIEVPVDLTAVGFNGAPLEIKNGQAVGNGLMKSSVSTGSVGVTFLWGKSQAEMASNQAASN